MTSFSSDECREHFPKVVVDIALSSDDDDAERGCMPGQNALVERDISAADDARGAGMTSVEATIPGPSEIGAPGSSRPPASEWGPIVPASGAHGRKHVRLDVKWIDPGPHANQLIIQVELPPYHGPLSPWT
jgi:hypothetical protein